MIKVDDQQLAEWELWLEDAPASAIKREVERTNDTTFEVMAIMELQGRGVAA